MGKRPEGLQQVRETDEESIGCASQSRKPGPIIEPDFEFANTVERGITNARAFTSMREGIHSKV